MRIDPNLQIFEVGLKCALPDATLAFDVPADLSGDWWIDVSVGCFETSLMWRAGLGFDVFTTEPGYGDRPDERYADPEAAARRIAQMEADWRRGHG